MIDAKRRILLKGSLAASAIGVAIGAGLLTPRMVLAAWPEAAFNAQNLDDALKGLLGSAAHEPSDKIDLKAPDIAENGAVVPVTVETTLEGATSISLVASGNMMPLLASFELGKGTLPFISTRIKMGKTANLIALVKAGDKVYSASKEVKVTVGGC
ncbi:MAG: thiosulfate oxidation carrier protein SoxY [Chromatiaceae bacterium]|jgi:sulfur-oxidizing protein SoxY|nr:thiosulfate oxidation carrier protein SoxY [Chromatiaceae bacterium]MBP6261408.1 thiosulfate oxidation carrier protein SoxY [Chromatiaceae bacterium]MBP9603627.1 thiosulfate oxidation carrier protein SoxY [Chromatiaceae bacterium]